MTMVMVRGIFSVYVTRMPVHFWWQLHYIILEFVPSDRIPCLDKRHASR